MKVLRQIIYTLALVAGISFTASAQNVGNEPRKPPPKEESPKFRPPQEKPPPKPREEKPKGEKPGLAVIFSDKRNVRC
jgi:hypothetical protein